MWPRGRQRTRRRYARAGLQGPEPDEDDVVTRRYARAGLQDNEKTVTRTRPVVRVRAGWAPGESTRALLLRQPRVHTLLEREEGQRTVGQNYPVKGARVETRTQCLLSA